jgi:hypothetical protein
LQRNPIETWTRAHFEQPILTGRGPLGIGAVVSDPAAIRRILVENAANYGKDALQKRILAPGLSHGLLTSEGDEWRMQRRALAPSGESHIETSCRITVIQSRIKACVLMENRRGDHGAFRGA